MLRSPTQRVSSAVLIALATVAARAQEERRPVDAPPHSRVFGRVVDETGKPLAGALATSFCVGDEWAKGVELPKIKWRGYELAALQARTGADGRFEFDVVTPTADWVSLVLEPDIYHDVASRDFGPAGGRDKPRLLAGDNDLGEFKLAATGAIAGRVLDEKSQPIAGAEVRLDNSFPGGLGRLGRSNAGGAFTIEHVPAGKYGIEALRDGYKIAKRANVAVAIDATTAAGELVLATAPTISGIVVDERGQPVANAWVWGWPEQSGSGGGGGSGAGARTDAQGHFVVALKQADPHRFEVTAEGFAKLEEPFAFVGRGAASHPVGATDIRLVLKRPVMTTFVVLDALTSKPVTRYAVALAWRPTPDGGSRGGGEPEYPLAEHENGEFTCAADPALFDYVISAPGHGPAKGSVTHESPTSPRCVVKLAAEAGLRGRVTLDGKPVARAEMLLYAGSLLRYDQEEDGGSGAFDEQLYFWSDWEGPQDLVFVLPRPTKLWSDADGRFAITGLASAEYRLEIWGEDGARKSLDPVGVAEGEAMDLGDVALVAGATLEGSVIVPAGIDASTIGLSCWSMGRAVRTQVNADRSFRFEGAAAGQAHVLVDKAVGLVTWGKSPEVQLAPGQSQRVTIDLNDRASVAATLHVLVNGKPAEGVSVFLQSAGGQGGDRMDETNAAGLSTGNVRALGPVDVTLRASSMMPLGRFAKQLDIAVGSAPEATIDVRCGALELEWPALSADEPLYLVQIGADMDSDDKRVFAHAMPRFDAAKFDARLTGDHTARFNWVPIGEREWTIDVQTVENNVVQFKHQFRRKIAFAAGETTRVELTERDRVPNK